MDLYYCRAERMQNKAETLKHETHFSPPKKALLFHLQGLWGKVEGPNWGRRGEEAEEDEEQGGNVKEVPAHLYKSLIQADSLLTMQV